MFVPHTKLETPVMDITQILFVPKNKEVVIMVGTYLSCFNISKIDVRASA
jgi:hypothetical protein